MLFILYIKGCFVTWMEALTSIFWYAWPPPSTTLFHTVVVMTIHASYERYLRQPYTCSAGLSMDEEPYSRSSPEWMVSIIIGCD